MMQLRQNVVDHGRGLKVVQPASKPAVLPTRNECSEESRGLQAPVRFFIDYCISVAVNSVVRKQALRTRMTVSTPEGRCLSLVVTTTEQSGETQFVAYNDNLYGLLCRDSGLLVANQTPRELEHSIYLYISERLSGQQTVTIEIKRETNSVYALPVLRGCSDQGVRSLA